MSQEQYKQPRLVTQMTKDLAQKIHEQNAVPLFATFAEYQIQGLRESLETTFDERETVFLQGAIAQMKKFRTDTLAPLVKQTLEGS